MTNFGCVRARVATARLPRGAIQATHKHYVALERSTSSIRWPYSGGKVVCPWDGPWSKEVIVLTLPSPPRVRADAPNLKRSRPWAIELINKSRWLAISGGAWGANPGPTGHPPAFVCGEDETDDVVYELNTEGKLWTAAFARKGSSQTREVPVRVAWR